MSTKTIYYAVVPLSGGKPTAVFKFYDGDVKLPERYTAESGWLPDQRLFSLIQSGDMGPGDIVNEEEAQLIVDRIKHEKAISG